MLKAKIKTFLAVVILLTLAACQKNEFIISAHFNNANDVKQGMPVNFGDLQVGQVVEVEAEGAITRVDLAIDKEQAAQISQNAAVVVNRLRPQTTLEIYSRTPADETNQLQDGQTIKGLDSMLQLGAWMVGDALQIGTKSVTEYVDSFQKYLNSEQFENDKETVINQIDSATNAAGKALKQVEQEIDRAKQDLANSEVAASQAIKELGDALAPLAGEMAKEGIQIEQEIERFAESLEQTEGDERELGEQFLNSLLETLQKLNQSVEEAHETDEVVE